MKLKKLLPIVGLTGIATITMPLTSCNKGSKDPDVPPVEDRIILNDPFEIFEDFGSLNSPLMSVEVDTEYKIKINFEDFLKYEYFDPDKTWNGIAWFNIMFGKVTQHGEDDPDVELNILNPDPEKLHVQIDGVNVPYVQEPDLPGDCPSWCFESFEVNSDYRFDYIKLNCHYTNLKIITLDLTFIEKVVEEGYFCFFQEK